MHIYSILNELNYSNLKANTSSDFSSRIPDAISVKIVNLEFIPSMHDDTMLVKANTKSDGPSYLTQINFVTVPYLNVTDQEKGVTVIGVDGNGYYFKKLKKSDVVEVNCTCKDFYYRFARFNYEKKALYGDEPERFDKHTDRAPQNPRQLPALCKHLQRLFLEITDRKLFS